MELRHLRYFIAVAEEGSLTLAAERRLHTAQPSLSRQIRDLELEVGAQLLIRGPRGVELTPAGRAFLDHARLALSQVEVAGEAARRAAQIAKEAGLRYVYAGNMPGRVGDLEHTRCPNCRELLIERVGYHVTGYHLTADGSCPKCGTSIPGRWAPAFQGQLAAYPFIPRRRSNRLTALPSPKHQ